MSFSALALAAGGLFCPPVPVSDRPARRLQEIDVTFRMVEGASTTMASSGSARTSSRKSRPSVAKLQGRAVKPCIRPKENSRIWILVQVSVLGKTDLHEAIHLLKDGLEYKHDSRQA